MSTAPETLLLAARDVRVEAAAGGKTPTVSIVAYTGGLMVVQGWGPIVIDLAGVDVSAPQISILADHDATLRGVVGYGRATVSDGKLLVAGAIAPTTSAARQIIELARAGFAFQASVGVTPVQWERIKAGDSVAVNGRVIRATGQGYTLVRASTLREVSIVAIGADAGTSVTIAATREREAMTTMTTTTTTTTEKTADDIRAAAAAETERINAIRAACGGRHGDIEARAIREGWDAQRTELEVLRASRPRGPAIHTTAIVPTQHVIEAAILARMGHEKLAEQHLGAQTAQQARDMRVTSLVDLCRAALLADGRDAPSGREALIRAALSTISLPVALGDAANKVLLEAYTDTPATWRAFAAIKSAADFRPHSGVRLSEIVLDTVAPGGELKHTSLGESVYQYSVDTFGRMLTIDRRDLLNDDLGLFEDAAASMGRAAARSLSDLVYTVLLSNAGGFFSGAHGN